MELFAISGLAGGLISFLFGSFIFLKDSQSTRGRVFLLLAFSGAVWGGAYWQWLTNSNNAIEAIYWVRILSVGSIMMPAFLFHWVILTTKARSMYWYFSSYVLYVVALLTAAAAFTPLLISGVEVKAIFPFWPIPGPLYLPHIIFLYTLPMIVAIMRVTYVYVSSNNKDLRGGMLYVLLGLLAGGIGAGSNFFLWFDIEVLPYGNFLIILFPVFLGYSMIKHSVFTARAVATELLLLLVNVFVFVRMLLADSPTTLFLEFVFFIAIAIASYMLLRSTYNEVSIRSDLKETLKKVKKLNKKLKEFDEKKTEFLHMATHQLRGPVTAINGYASLIKDGDYGKVSKEMNEPIAKILSAGKVMKDTINDYMNIARIEENRLGPVATDFDLSALVRERAAVRRLSAKEKGITLEMDTSLSKEHRVHADKQNLTQVINALLENAIKYTKEGSVRVKMKPTKGGTHVQVAVSDSGIGVAKDELEGLFDKFSRASNAKKANIFGTGMGLFIAKGLMEANGGSIKATSEGENKGTTFTIELPTVGA
jgi:signal transduction histidine kinase